MCLDDLVIPLNKEKLNKFFLLKKTTFLPEREILLRTTYYGMEEFSVS